MPDQPLDLERIRNRDECWGGLPDDYQAGVDRRALLAEVKRLRAGEDRTPRDPAVYLTPGQWIAMFNDSSPEQRLAAAAAAISNGEMAINCFTLNHAHRLEELRAELTDMREQLRAGEASDGHHTHNELYEYRLLYNAAAANAWAAAGTYPIVKSWRHSNGEECFGGGWFIVVAELPTGQVSNHYQAEHWDLFRVPAVDLPPEFDGHTPAEASTRLRAALAGGGTASLGAIRLHEGRHWCNYLDDSGREPRIFEEDEACPTLLRAGERLLAGEGAAERQSAPITGWPGIHDDCKETRVHAHSGVWIAVCRCDPHASGEHEPHCPIYQLARTAALAGEGAAEQGCNHQAPGQVDCESCQVRFVAAAAGEGAAATSPNDRQVAPTVGGEGATEQPSVVPPGWTPYDPPCRCAPGWPKRLGSLHSEGCPRHLPAELVPGMRVGDRVYGADNLWHQVEGC